MRLVNINDDFKNNNHTELEFEIEFDPSNKAEQAFKNALIASFSQKKKAEYLVTGDTSSCIDFSTDGQNRVKLTGIGEYLNYHLHSPPLDLSQLDRVGVSEESFWGVGNEFYNTGRIQAARNYAEEHGTVFAQHHRSNQEKVLEIRKKLQREEIVRSFISDLLNGALTSVNGDYISLESGYLYTVNKELQDDVRNNSAYSNKVETALHKLLTQHQSDSPPASLSSRNEDFFSEDDVPSRLDGGASGRPKP